jgi:cysteine desulfurase/selenocysteine lyase
MGVLYGRERLLKSLRPFLYGGDMIAEGEVHPDRVGYSALPWKFSAGTPNILGTIVSAQALRLLLDLALNPWEHRYFRTRREITAPVVARAMDQITRHTQRLTRRALDGLSRVEKLRIYGPTDDKRRTSLVAFTIEGLNPMAIAAALNDAGIESRAGCHCATLAHHEYRLDPPASCRLSFFLYNSPDEVDFAVNTVADIAGGRLALPVPGAGGQFASSGSS